MTTITEPVAPPKSVLTYEQYMTEPTDKRRYDIIDGVRIVTNPTWQHQDIQGNIYEAFRVFQRTFKQGRTVQAPCDVLIRVSTLQTRQPDVLFMSMARLALNPPRTAPSPRSPAPELVVEIVSPSDKPKVLNDKIKDYQSVNVKELWAVRPEPQTIEVLALTQSSVQSVATYQRGETVQSLTFPDLRVAVADIFAE